MYKYVVDPRTNHGIMHVIAKRTLQQFWQRPGCADAREPLEAWCREAKSAEWKTPAEIKEKYRSASILKGGRVVFNIKGNDYRLVAHIHYHAGAVYVRFVGTHEEYDRINAEEI
jgi:mRNA interferase HigB